MEMMIGTPDGKYYSEVWRESDNFNSRGIIEISKRKMRENCIGSQDYVVYRKLTIRERLDKFIVDGDL